MRTLVDILKVTNVDHDLITGIQGIFIVIEKFLTFLIVNDLSLRLILLIFIDVFASLVKFCDTLSVRLSKRVILLAEDLSRFLHLAAVERVPILHDLVVAIAENATSIGLIVMLITGCCSSMK